MGWLVLLVLLVPLALRLQLVLLLQLVVLVLLVLLLRLLVVLVLDSRRFTPDPAQTFQPTDTIDIGTVVARSIRGAPGPRRPQYTHRRARHRFGDAGSDQSPLQALRLANIDQP